MKAERIFVFLCGVVLLYSLSFPVARADEWNKKTTVTFSGPVDVSGHRLEAGTYVFKLADTVDRHVVQIFTGDEKHIIATILAIPDYRVTPEDKTSIKFSETAENVSTMQRDLPEGGIQIKEWFYPGDNFGQEFRVKPAMEVAETAATISTTTSETTAPALTSEATPETLPSPEEKSEEKPVETAAVLPQQEPTPATPQETKEPESSPDQSAKTPSELPQTASSLPLIGLVGLVSVGVGLSLRQFGKRMA